MAADPDLSCQCVFESDHPNLKENKDYQDLLKSLVQLETQRMLAIKDLESLVQIRKEALHQPIRFAAAVMSDTPPPMPRPQDIAELPNIDWSKYPSAEVDPPPFNQKSLPSREPPSSDQVYIRGRKADETKPESFNRLWTVEEQAKLEYLLEVYPPEEKEIRRWERIAKALTNRTSKQVASRVQKYFQALAKAGLPVPGRIPKAKRVQKPRKRKRGVSKARQAANAQRSTFFATYQPSVLIPEDVVMEMDAADVEEILQEEGTSE